MIYSCRSGLRTFLRKTIIRLVLVCTCFLFGTSIATGEYPSITIAETAWTNGIDKNKNPAKRFLESVHGTRQLYLWTKVQGTEEALDYLQTKGKLPIFHQWFIYLGPYPQFDETLDPIDAVKLAVGKHEVIQKLSWQIHEKGYFEWRTWSAKQNLRPGWWKVKVVYADGEPVSCEDKPCEYVIEIE